MLFWLIILGLIIYLLVKSDKKPDPNSLEARLAERNTQWIRFIAGYHNIAKSKTEKALIDRMLSDVEKQGLTTRGEVIMPYTEAQATKYTAKSTLVATEESYDFGPDPAPKVDTPKIELDNASLLLYFGAFLFVASVGLFITFGGANGAVRTIAVFLVMGVLYSAGIWIFRSKPKLVQAGIAFSGIGMTIAPLVGLAAYYYLFEQTGGPAIWFVTSLMCMLMYIHALWVFRRPLVSYILIFTFLSLFESGVSIISAPIYYFGWAMALVGIILAVSSRLKGFWPELQETSAISSKLILPLSVLTSLVLVPTHGTGQLGISLLFAAAFYGLEALNSKDSDREINAVSSHITVITGVGSLSYAAGNSWKLVAITLLLINAVQLLIIILIKQSGKLWQNFASVLIGSALTGILAGIASPGILLAATAIMVPIGLAVWHRQGRSEGYTLAVLAWMAWPMVLGQVFLTVRLEPGTQAVLLFSFMLVQLCLYLWHKPKNQNPLWLTGAQQLFLISAITVIVTALFASPWVCFGITSAVVTVVILLAELEKDGAWAVVAGLMAASPMIRAIGTPGALSAVTATALMVNIILSLRFRKPQNRLFSTILWLIMPLSFGSGLTETEWSAAHYAWAYLAVMLGLILSRVIARGGLIISGNVPLASYEKSASYSYVTGYWLSAVAAVCLSLAAGDSRFHATIILSIISGVVYWLGRFIEKRPDYMLILPLLTQSVLWSAIRPVANAESMTIYLLLSTTLALATYFLASAPQAASSESSDFATKLQEGGIAAVFVTPFSALIINRLLWPMPFGLLVAGLLVYYHIRNTSQQNRELSGGIVVSSVLWFMWFGGLRELQAYTHVIIVMLGFYAYWRAKRQETEQSDQYLMLMLGVATLPLALQALGGKAGGLYGWWLLLEQVAFMLIGMAIGKRFVTLWGLYVAVGAVLYQLRNLGWAALTVLAVFLIGIAVYKLQRPINKS